MPSLIPADGSSVDVVKLAHEANVDADLLYRYMRFVSTVGVFKELPNRHFAHTESSKELFPGHILFYRMLFWASKPELRASAELATQMRDLSKSALEHAHNTPLWQMFAQNPQLEKHFADYMAISTNKIMPELLQKIKLPESGIIVDMGGGYGHTLLEFLKAKPNLRGIVFELPTVAKRVEEGLKNPSPPGDTIYSKYPMDIKNRASVVPGSYTDGNQLMQIANADVFFFKWIFHDNSDTVCRMILKGLYQIMKPTAMIIICDNVLKPTLNEWKFPILLDLTMAQILNA